jgi:hypothetical protein
VRATPCYFVLVSRAALLVLAALAAACNKDGSTTTAATVPAAASGASVHQGDCGHAVCGSNFFLDEASPPDCAVGATCAVTLKLTATGDYHINQDYPYKFHADDTAGLEYLGTDAAGKATFSKAASNWRTPDEKSGVMTVSFRPGASGTKAVAGTFKLSVCSKEQCQLEQQQVSTTVAVR